MKRVIQVKKASGVAAVLGALALAACGPLGGNQSQYVDGDGDGFSPAQGDCDDGNAAVYPGAPENADGVDNDCNGGVDDNLFTVDDDGDGASEQQGDCDDANALVGPKAVEVDYYINEQGETVADGVDNDCDGKIDEGVDPCDDGLSGDDPKNFAKAMELCDQFLLEASWSAGTDTGRNILSKYGGFYEPVTGESFIAMSSGTAVAPHVSFSGGGSTTHPAHDSTMNDPVLLKLKLQAPSNVEGFSFDFFFQSQEFAYYCQSQFNDRFYAWIESEGFTGNISFDEKNNPISINAGFFDVCDPNGGASGYTSDNVRKDCVNNSELVGTGFETNGGTGWLRTSMTVKPGEIFTLTLMIFDQSDHALDSTVVIDNFQWAGKVTPGTVPQ